MKKATITLGLLVALGLTSCYDFSREQDEKDAVTAGKCILFKAESSKKAKVEQAKADYESAKLEADTRIIEAEASAKTKMIEANAKAKAIQVVGDALRTNQDYLKFQMIEGMYRYKSDKTVYIPTEANLPIITTK
jgi:regulator of protease activity HflC (stomatin/prohibitin superfamily)